MKIIHTYDLIEGDVIDFTTKEPMYWNKRLPQNKIQKMECPYCGRIARVDNHFETYDHKVKVQTPFPNVFDKCETPKDVCEEVQTIRRTTALNLPLDTTLFSQDAIRIAKLRGFIQISV